MYLCINVAAVAMMKSRLSFLHFGKLHFIFIAADKFLYSLDTTIRVCLWVSYSFEGAVTFITSRLGILCSVYK